MTHWASNGNLEGHIKGIAVYTDRIEVTYEHIEKHYPKCEKHIGIMSAEHPRTCSYCDALRHNTGKVRKEIYRPDDGKIVLAETIHAEFVPKHVEPEHVVWPGEEETRS